MFELSKTEKYNQVKISDLSNLLNQVELSPFYQRFSDIWSPGKKKLLIDSIINGYDMPKFYFHYVLTRSEDIGGYSKKFAVIDGKQRLSTILEFISKEMVLDNSVRYLERPDLEFKGVTYKKICNDPSLIDIKYNIDNYVIDIVNIITDEYERIEEMFLRLNNGMPVNNAERRNAIGGALIETIKNRKQDFKIISKVPFSNNRMEHLDLILKLAFLEGEKSIESLTNTKLNEFVKSYKTDKPKEKNDVKINAELLIERVKKHSDELSKIFVDKDRLLRSKGIIILYYWYFIDKKPKGEIFKSFLDKFYDKRENNRKIENIKEANRTLIEFDRLNQQAAHTKNSILKRLEILDFFYLKFKDITGYSFSDELPSKPVKKDEPIDL